MPTIRSLPLAAIAALTLASTPVLAQTGAVDDGSFQEQASLPDQQPFGRMIQAMGTSDSVGARIAGMGEIPPGSIDYRDAHALEMSGGNRDDLARAFDDNRDRIGALRQDLVENHSVSMALAQKQIPFDHVMAAEIERDGKLVIYAYPQGVVPPQ